MGNTFSACYRGAGAAGADTNVVRAKDHVSKGKGDAEACVRQVHSGDQDAVPGA
jgi:hypothetical protein